MEDANLKKIVDSYICMKNVQVIFDRANCMIMKYLNISKPKDL